MSGLERVLSVQGKYEDHSIKLGEVVELYICHRKRIFVEKRCTLVVLEDQSEAGLVDDKDDALLAL